MPQASKMPLHSKDELAPGSGGFTSLVRYTLTGFAGALLLGVILDRLHLQTNGLAEWAVRVLSGQGEDLAEGFFAVRRRLSGQPPSMAEAYGWGKVSGMVVPWIVDAGTRLLGVNVSGPAGFYIPWLYGMSDQIGASIAGFMFIFRRRRSLSETWRLYLAQPVMLASLLVVPLGAILPLTARLLGLRPSTEVRVAIETGLANLSWLPPVVGWYTERRSRTVSDAAHRQQNPMPTQATTGHSDT